METMPFIPVFESRSEREINDALQKIDERLFLDKEADHLRRVFYVVSYWNGERAPDPVSPVIDWRDPDGTPRPLSDAVLVEVARMRRRGPIDVSKVIAKNEALKESHDRERQEAYRDLVYDMERAARRSGSLHRSVALRVARDKMRARGERV